MYASNGTRIYFAHRCGDTDDRAICHEASKAVELLNDALRLNDGRKYTASARKNAQAESLSGFRWLNAV